MDIDKSYFEDIREGVTHICDELVSANLLSSPVVLPPDGGPAFWWNLGVFYNILHSKVPPELVRYDPYVITYEHIDWLVRDLIDLRDHMGDHQHRLASLCLPILKENAEAISLLNSLVGLLQWFCTWVEGVERNDLACPAGVISGVSCGSNCSVAVDSAVHRDSHVSLGLGNGVHCGSCLLYTSPSPRD